MDGIKRLASPGVLLTVRDYALLGLTGAISYNNAIEIERTFGRDRTTMTSAPNA